MLTTWGHNTGLSLVILQTDAENVLRLNRFEGRRARFLVEILYNYEQ